jgi:hypothetical protein
MSRSYKQPYTKSKRFDKTCRCNGSCDYCRENRLHQSNKLLTLDQELKIDNYNMIQPESKLPWTYINKCSEYDIIDCNKQNVINFSITDSDYAPIVEDAKYIVQAANQYPILLDFLEKLEATTTDEVTASKVRELLIEQKIWK